MEQPPTVYNFHNRRRGLQTVRDLMGMLSRHGQLPLYYTLLIKLCTKREATCTVSNLR